MHQRLDAWLFAHRGQESGASLLAHCGRLLQSRWGLPAVVYNLLPTRVYPANCLHMQVAATLTM